MSQVDNPSIQEENRRIRTFRFMTDLTVQRLYVERLSLADAHRLIKELRTLAGKLFPGKENVFDLVIAPRLKRALLERFLPRN